MSTKSSVKKTHSNPTKHNVQLAASSGNGHVPPRPAEADRSKPEAVKAAQARKPPLRQLAEAAASRGEVFFVPPEGAAQLGGEVAILYNQVG